MGRWSRERLFSRELLCMPSGFQSLKICFRLVSLVSSSIPVVSYIDSSSTFQKSSRYHDTFFLKFSYSLYDLNT